YYGSTPTLPLLPPALKGTHRRSDVVFNKALIYSSYDWFELLNYGRAFNLEGWTIDIYSRTGAVGTYTFDANSVMNPGEIMWLSEPSGIFFTLDRLHKNTGVDSLWEGTGATPAGGALVLRDKGGRVRDTLVFGSSGGALPSLADAYWAGPPVHVGATDFWELRKTADGFAPGAANWTDLSYAGSSSWGVLSPGQTGAKFHQDEIGTAQSDSAATV